uniref:Uncharacterized protein n=1 Tax=Panagrolaimus sp. PS1159 TaxID=55785 RepID=A0AC35FXT4_9BILA
IRMLMIHPPVLIMLSKHSAVDKYDLSSIEIIFSGAAPAGKDIIEDVKQKHPNLKQVTQGYGATECLVATFPDNIENMPNGSVGKVVPLGKAKVIDIETGKELSYNQPGEILFFSPTVTPGYLNRPEATKESIDAEGCHSSIADAAVIGISNGAAGEVPKAYIVRKDKTLKEVEVMEFVKERVAYYKQLTGGVEFINEIPKNPTGKILRRALREKNQDNANSTAPILTVYHLNN